MEMRFFVDTSAWYALNDQSDQSHQQAVAFLRSITGQRVELYTSDYVLDETLTLLKRKVSHDRAVHFLNDIQASKVVQVICCDPKLFQAGEKIFRGYSDKFWSFTDCLSFACMDRLSLSAAFTFDAHFSQYGKTIHP